MNDNCDLFHHYNSDWNTLADALGKRNGIVLEISGRTAGSDHKFLRRWSGWIIQTSNETGQDPKLGDEAASVLCRVTRNHCHTSGNEGCN